MQSVLACCLPVHVVQAKGALYPAESMLGTSCIMQPPGVGDHISYMIGDPYIESQL